MNENNSHNNSSGLETFRITYTRGGKQFIATVRASSEEEAKRKLMEDFSSEDPFSQAPNATKRDNIHLFVQGTHCASCEVLIEGKFKKIPGVENVTVNYRTGEANVVLKKGAPTPSLASFESAVSERGYSVKRWGDLKERGGFLSHWTGRDFKEVGAMLLVLFGGYLLLRQYDLIPKLAVTEGASYPFIFLVGLVAAGSSCLAVTGGLLLSISGSWSQVTVGQGTWKRFQPHLLFNIGRLVSYAILGGFIGVLGKAIAVSSQLSGILTVLAAVFMVLTGLSMLNIIQKNPLLVSLPKRFQNAIHDASGDSKKKFGMPFLIGAATFFLPCGFTQALQLYAVTTGSFEKGALTMLVFALGTMPALLGIGLLSTVTKGAPYRYFLKFAGTLVLFLALFNLSNGMALVGIDPGAFAALVFRAPAGGNEAAVTQDLSVIFDGNSQIVSMKVLADGYSPNTFTVKKGIPVEWQIEGVETSGCTSILTLPKYGIEKQIRPGANVIQFTPEKTGTIAFHCSMAMFRGKFTVID